MRARPQGTLLGAGCLNSVVPLRTGFAVVAVLGLVFAQPSAPLSKAAVPAMELEALDVIGGQRDHAQTRKEIVDNFGRVRLCFDKAAGTKNRWLHGRIALSYIIASDGSAREGKIVSDDIEGDESTAPCILNIMLKHRYPAAKGTSRVLQRWHLYYPDGRGGIRKGVIYRGRA